MLNEGKREKTCVMACGAFAAFNRKQCVCYVKKGIEKEEKKKKKKSRKNASAAAVLSMQTECVITIIWTQTIAFSPALFAANAYVRVWWYICIVAIVAICSVLCCHCCTYTPVFP